MEKKGVRGRRGGERGRLKEHLPLPPAVKSEQEIERENMREIKSTKQGCIPALTNIICS